jgi:succinate dehydrogenase/fumarate reductase-like Fe-S protein
VEKVASYLERAKRRFKKLVPFQWRCKGQNVCGTCSRKKSGKLEVAQQIANRESPRTTKVYDRRPDEISLDEIERITI